MRDLGPNKAQLQGRIHALEAQIAALHRSTSWRVTAPLRRAGTLLQRLRGRGPAPDTGLNKEGGYGEWVRRFDTPAADLAARLLADLARWPTRPRISVLMPTYNPKPAWLREAIESVRAQIYPDWELCIADDASTQAEVRELLARYAKDDARIKLVLRPQNGHISAASNSALEIASGGWIVLMDHDDLMPAHALWFMAREIALHPEARLVYSDEDKIDAAGRRYDPYFKPDWNLDLFLSQNVFSHLGAYETALVRAVGGFRIGFEGAQDHDLVLRCIERIRPDQIRHVPRVLYHWRAHEQSTAQSHEAKPYAQIAGERALDEHFQRIGVAATAEGTPDGYRAHYALPEALPRVTLIIPTRNGEALVRQCIESIVTRTRYANYEILLVDNGSDDASALAYFSELGAQPGITVIRDDRPFNYSALNNMAARHARGELLALVNNDIEVIAADWLGEMVSLALQPGVGAVGAKLLYPDETVQHGGVVLGIGAVAGHAHKHLPNWHGGHFSRSRLIQSFSAVTAACLVVRKALYEQVGGLDETHLQIAFNDVDFCLRLREAGYRNVWTPYAELFHHESVTRGHDVAPAHRERFERESAYMRERWGALLQNDPAHNPNLANDVEDFSLAWPPRLAPLNAYVPVREAAAT
jgi:glycosyltransferase involved in cell wall biosynthesis